MEFGIFDHLDRNDLPPAGYYGQPLQLTEIYDRAASYRCHIAEHRFTPLGIAPPSGVLLSSVAQRTRRLRGRSIIHCACSKKSACSIYVSRGRLHIGFGSGSVLFEIAYYSQNIHEREQIYHERLEIIMHAFTTEVLNWPGQFDGFENVPMEMKPFQRPHSPVFFRAQSSDCDERAARQGLNIIHNDTTKVSCVCIAPYRKIRHEIGAKMQRRRWVSHISSSSPRRMGRRAPSPTTRIRSGLAASIICTDVTTRHQCGASALTSMASSHWEPASPGRPKRLQKFLGTRSCDPAPNI